ncbi:MAG TPA: zinc ribbon domain-containing protein, partial [Blastocatellia bacterium]
LLTMVILFGLYIIFIIILFMLILIVGIIVGFVMAIGMPQWAVTSITVCIALFAIAACLFIVSMFVARIIFLPHVVMIEGQSAGSAVGRAMRLGGRNSLKVGAILLFTYFVSLSLMAALTLPVLAGLYLAGLLTSDFFSSTTWTVFYISFKDLSSLLSLPIWIVSFTLLYFDSRVRKEAYDLDLLARDIAPGYYWQPLAEAGAFGYQMPTSYGQGRAYVQTSPLGLAGYSHNRPPPVNAPPPRSEPPRSEPPGSAAIGPQPEQVAWSGEGSHAIKTAINDPVMCDMCGISIDPDAPFCGNCGSPINLSRS